jgi:hypothetical protein
MFDLGSGARIGETVLPRDFSNGKWSYGRNRELGFLHGSTNALRSWLLRKPILASARLLEALPLLPVKLLLESYRVSD